MNNRSEIRQNCLSSVQFSHSVVSYPLWPHGLQHTKLPCPSSTPRTCSNSCSLSRKCHPTIPSSVVPFSSCLQSLPASGYFPVSQFFTSGGPSIGASASVFPMSNRVNFLYDWLVWSSCCPSNSQESSPAPQSKGINFSAFSLLYGPTLTSIHDYWKKPQLWLHKIISAF